MEDLFVITAMQRCGV